MAETSFISKDLRMRVFAYILLFNNLLTYTFFLFKISYFQVKKCKITE